MPRILHIMKSCEAAQYEQYPSVIILYYYSTVGSYYDSYKIMTIAHESIIMSLNSQFTWSLNEMGWYYNKFKQIE